MKKFTVFKVISIVFIVAVAVLMAILFSDVVSQAKADNSGWEGLGVAIAIMLGMVYVGGIGGGVAFLSATIGLICTLKTCPKGERKGQVWTFIILMAMPFVLELLFYLGIILMK